MDERDDRLAQRFEENRARLRAMAHRTLGSISEADDAVQEARLNRSDTSGTDNPGRWLMIPSSLLVLSPTCSQRD